MTIKRAILVILTILAITFIGRDLLESWSQPQFQSRLELYQTNLLLHTAEYQDKSLSSTRKVLLGNEPIKSALEQYQDSRQSAQKNLDKFKTLSSSASSTAIATSVSKLEQLITELDLRIGILQVQQNQGNLAQKTWTDAIQRSASQPNLETLNNTAQILQGLWSNPPRLLPDAESRIKKNLTSWFRYVALSRLYTLQNRQEALTTIRTDEQLVAEQALISLAIVGGLPTLSCFIGVVILLFLGVQWFLLKKQALIDPSGLESWTTPWDGETVWQVLIFGFFLVGQILIPLMFSIGQEVTSFNPATLGERGKAFYILANYILLATGGLFVLFLSIKPFLPLPAGWFQFRLKASWPLWGLGGYFAALPLVILVSLINQKIWQGQGGSNPILPIALEGKDTLAISIFFATAAIAAPIFEEILFRGFLLPSLTRYLPLWGAIALSSLIFAIAHLSLSEVLPLTVLGMVLGFVYARSRNLLSSMLLHSLWNSGTLISLIILGNSAN